MELHTHTARHRPCVARFGDWRSRLDKRANVTKNETKQNICRTIDSQLCTSSSITSRSGEKRLPMTNYTTADSFLQEGQNERTTSKTEVALNTVCG